MENDPKFKTAVALVLKHEGHLSNDPRDPGGITNYGISLRYLESLKQIDPDTGYLFGDMDHDGDLDADDVRLMTPGEATKIYHIQWWDRYRYGQISDDRTAIKMLDLSVNMGPGRAHRLIQETVNSLRTPQRRLIVDGRIGPATIAAINAQPTPAVLLCQFQQMAIGFYKGLDRPEYVAGWINRVLDF